MANLESRMVTSTFPVKDFDAFKAEFDKLTFEDFNIDQVHENGMLVEAGEPNTNMVVAYGYDFLTCEQEDENEDMEMIETIPLFQKHLTDDGFILINAVYFEKYRYIAGESTIITKETFLVRNAEDCLRRAIHDKLPDIVLPERV